jgi:cyclophilin family peptidyl-prolyl cis-trans isomerase/protein-disulfide isomerase
MGPYMLRIRRFLPLLLVIACLTACSPAVSQSSEFALPTPTAQQLGPTSTRAPASPTTTPVAPQATLVPLAPISGDDWSIGPEEAAVTLLIYTDFQCPYCAKLAPVLSDLRAAHPQDVRIIFRQYPLLPIHDKAALAGQAAEAAGEQGKFWEMHDLLFARQADWAELTPEQFRTWLVDAAGDIGLEAAQFRRNLEDGAAAAHLEDAFHTGVASGIPGTPFLFFNNDLFQIATSRENLEAVTRLTLQQGANAGATPPPPADRNLALKAILRFNLGTVEVLLFPARAPQAVGSFVDLARRGWYDGSPVYRVLPGSLIELGDPSGTGYGDAGYRFADEIDPALGFEQPGMLGLASSGPDTNGSIFFITLAPLPELTGGRTIFGQVVGGLEVLQSLPERDPLPDLLLEPPAILLSVEIIES